MFWSYSYGKLNPSKQNEAVSYLPDFLFIAVVAGDDNDRFGDSCAERVFGGERDGGQRVGGTLSVLHVLPAWQTLWDLVECIKQLSVHGVRVGLIETVVAIAHHAVAVVPQTGVVQGIVDIINDVAEALNRLKERQMILRYCLCFICIVFNLIMYFQASFLFTFVSSFLFQFGVCLKIAKLS